MLKEFLFIVSLTSGCIVAFGIAILIGRGQTPLKFINKDKFIEEKQNIANKLENETTLNLYKKLSLYGDKYLIIYLLYRSDLIFYWLVCGGLTLFVLSVYLSGIF